MPDEIAIAHKWRIGWNNECGSEKAVDKLLLQAAGKSREGARKKTQLYYLAVASGMSPTAYAHQHSLLPFLCFATDGGRLYGDSSSEDVSRLFGMATAHNAAHCCVQCIAEDTSRWQFSWFRRSHQLTGIEWCPVHGCCLSKIDDPNPFTRSPHYWLTKSKLQQVRPYVKELPTSGFVRRYTDIVTAFLQQAQAFRVDDINLQMANRVSERGASVRTVEGHKHRPISGYIEKLAPSKWLSKNFSDFSPKARFTPRQVDSIATRMNTGRRAHSYALVLSALYDSSEAALTATYNPGLVRRESRSGVSSTGKVSQGKNSSRLEKAFQRFRNGESICAASSAEKIAASELETHLRNFTLDVSKYVADA